MINNTFVNMIKIGAVSFIFDKGLRVLGKKNLGQIIKFTGVLGIGIECINLLIYWKTNPPKIVETFQTLQKNYMKINNALEKFFSITEKLVR